MSDLVIVCKEAHALGGGLNGFREALQRHILRALAKAGFFQDLAFVGGTALRVCHGLNRFSEDLDFAVLRDLTAERLIEIGELVFDAARELGLAPSARRDMRTIPMGGSVDKQDYIFLLDADLPEAFQAGGKRLSLRLNVDRNPAAGWQSEALLAHAGGRPFAIRIHDRPSLFAGKLHVLCCRTDRAKGRDFYDLAWYLAQNIKPNLSFLQATINALEPKPWQAESWAIRLRDRLETVDFDRLRQDLEPFLKDRDDLMLMDREVLLNSLASMR